MVVLQVVRTSVGISSSDRSYSGMCPSCCDFSRMCQTYALTIVIALHVDWCCKRQQSEQRKNRYQCSWYFLLLFIVVGLTNEDHGIIAVPGTSFVYYMALQSL